ncbi:dATP/dGTP diphosphohydrolase domain-containing protein [Anaerofustis sp. HA2171]|uniref:dATP/dGTP diphosphohydrolase domain-containing protein n=1 Tax=Anaerofustis butyriciformans TaxID=3108533 RepID=UPI002E302A63|nr:dATP/dGTP diphosphohydrolase domain-containing protein [Anaerofustis sp. HA2171]
MLNDSGDREKFESGAVRDMKKGRGRCDLLPLDIITKFLFPIIDNDKDNIVYSILYCLDCYIRFNDKKQLYNILECAQEDIFEDRYTMLLELSIHFEEGAEKYGVDNWQKGIPEWSYIDSAIRHLLKWARGDEDERHDRAFVWNIICLIWTIENKGDNDDINNFYCTN